MTLREVQVRYLQSQHFPRSQTRHSKNGKHRGVEFFRGGYNLPDLLRIKESHLPADASVWKNNIGPRNRTNGSTESACGLKNREKGLKHILNGFPGPS